VSPSGSSLEEKCASDLLDVLVPSKLILHTAEVAAKFTDGLVETVRLTFLNRQKKGRSRVSPLSR
jgi:hypothetical protein